RGERRRCEQAFHGHVERRRGRRNESDWVRCERDLHRRSGNFDHRCRRRRGGDLLRDGLRRGLLAATADLLLPDRLFLLRLRLRCNRRSGRELGRLDGGERGGLCRFRELLLERELLYAQRLRRLRDVVDLLLPEAQVLLPDRLAHAPPPATRRPDADCGGGGAALSSSEAMTPRTSMPERSRMPARMSRRFVCANASSAFTTRRSVRSASACSIVCIPRAVLVCMIE